MPPLAFLALSIYQGVNGNAVAAALSGAVFAMLVIYLLFPFSGFTSAAFVDIGAKIRDGESSRAFHLRCAGYWFLLVVACTAVLFIGALVVDASSSWRNSALAGAFIYFVAPILGVAALVKALAEVVAASRR